MIIETEAYHQREAACHGRSGVPTRRTAALFGQPGTAYVYFTYGCHHCVNVVCEGDGTAAAALLRAVAPLTGVELMRARRTAARRPGASELRRRELCNGPARLVQALDISPCDDGADLIGRDAPLPANVNELDELARRVASPLLLPQLAWLAADTSASAVGIGPRIGISQARDLPWRFALRDAGPLSRPI
jgi:DNA-3-methyladenine glycosylase